MFETSYIQLDSQKYLSNLAFLTKEFSLKTCVCLVIKGNAYGHGAHEIMNLAQDFGHSIFAVFSANEALDVLPAKRLDSRLLIMGDIDFPQMEWAIEHGLELCINNPTSLNEALQIAQKMKTAAKIHLEFETGMNRLGFEVDEFAQIEASLAQHPGDYETKGFCTHLAGSESIQNFKRVKKQISNFDKICRDFAERNIRPEDHHIACSAAAIRIPKSRYQMIRVGILQYGFWPSHETYIEYITKKNADHNPLQRIITWKSRVMAVKKVSAGQYVGYGTSFMANSKRNLAIIPVGYSDGFARSLSNQGHVLVRGQRAPVVGTVNMNALTVDVTDIAGVDIGDEVVLIGGQGDQIITISSFSDISNQLNYELLSRLSRDIPRIIV